MPDPTVTRWQDIAPADAADIDCRTRPDLSPPRNEAGEICPWPWEPQQLGGAPLGQYRCHYCMAMCVAGMPHPDYGPTAHPLIGKRVHATTAHQGDPAGPDQPGVTLEADVVHTGILLSATYDGEAAITDDTTGRRITLWPALDVTEAPPLDGLPLPDPWTGQ